MIKKFVNATVTGTYTRIVDGKPITENYTKNIVTTKRIKDESYYSQVEKTFDEQGLLTIDKIEISENKFFMSDEDFIANSTVVIEDKKENEK